MKPTDEEIESAKKMIESGSQIDLLSYDFAHLMKPQMSMSAKPHNQQQTKPTPPNTSPPANNVNPKK